jgi:hypothetical protein
MPAYYDYSESFYGQEEHLPLAGPAERPIPMLNQVIHEDVPTPFHREAQTPFGIRDGSRFQPVELPTKHNRKASEISNNDAKPNSRHSAKRSLSGAGPRRATVIDRPATSNGAIQLVSALLND